MVSQHTRPADSFSIKRLEKYIGSKAPSIKTLIEAPVADGSVLPAHLTRDIFNTGIMYTILLSYAENELLVPKRIYRKRDLC